MSYQKIIIVGNLGQEPEMRYTPDGTPVTNFSMAVNRRWTNPDGSMGEQTTWFRVTAWRRTAEVAAEYLSKGREVMVEGRMNPDKATGGPRIWTGQDGVARANYEITADRIVFLHGGVDDSRGEDTTPVPSSASPSEDEIPF